MKTINSILHSPIQNRQRRNSNDDSSYFSIQQLQNPRKYFSRKFSDRISWHELPLEKNARGINTAPGIFFLIMRLMVPLAYIYIVLILLRELCQTFPDTLYTFLRQYITPLSTIIDKMQTSSIFVEIWVVIEALFYIIQILHIRYLQYKDPLEASLSAAPIATLDERRKLMDQMLDQMASMRHINPGGCNDGDAISFIRGWFFDEELENITRYDVLDICTWSMFEGRNQEHLTEEEVGQLNWFVGKLECVIAVSLYGEKEEEEEEDNDEFNHDGGDSNDDMGVVDRGANDSFQNHVMDDDDFYLNLDHHPHSSNDDDKKHVKRSTSRLKKRNMIYFQRSEESARLSSFDDHQYYDDEQLDDFDLYVPTIHQQKNSNSASNNHHTNISKKKICRYPTPKKAFRFPQTTHDETPGFFTNLFENYNQKYQQYKNKKLQEMQSVQNLRNFVANKRQQFVEAEDYAMTAATNMYEHAKFTFIHKGGSIDKRMNAISYATQQQLTDAWNSVGKMKERVETAKFVSSRKRYLEQQHKGYHMLLERIIHSSSVPPRQIVDLLQKITQCNESLNMIEDSAVDSFLKVTGFARKSLLQQKEPKRYAKYSGDELLGLAAYPLAFNLLILGLTDGLLRFVMAGRGFERLNIGTTVYYYHPGRKSPEGKVVDDETDEHDEDADPLTPIVFCHGIGIGLGYYLGLIDELLKLGRPLFLPEIPYVCGFRPWISRNSILTPPAVISTLTAMLASHGHMKASFIGHSYGTSWVSYMCKYAKDTMASVLFLDPICFCLHHPCLTKSFVYHRADPGSVSYMVKTDVIINWTIQRSFPWSRIILFVEDIPDIPCSIYLSAHDVLIPIDIVERYLKSKGAHFCDDTDVTPDHFKKGPINVTVFRNDAHGEWTDRPPTAKQIATTARILNEKYEGLH